VIISDEQLERLGRYYTSEFVRKVMPWVTEVPFHEWLERQDATRKAQHMDVIKYREVINNEARF